MKTLEAMRCEIKIEMFEHKRPGDICVNFGLAKFTEFDRPEKRKNDAYPYYQTSILPSSACMVASAHAEISKEADCSCLSRVLSSAKYLDGVALINPEILACSVSSELQ